MKTLRDIVKDEELVRVLRNEALTEVIGEYSGDYAHFSYPKVKWMMDFFEIKTEELSNY